MHQRWLIMTAGMPSSDYDPECSCVPIPERDYLATVSSPTGLFDQLWPAGHSLRSQKLYPVISTFVETGKGVCFARAISDMHRCNLPLLSARKAPSFSSRC